MGASGPSARPLLNQRNPGPGGIGFVNGCPGRYGGHTLLLVQKFKVRVRGLTPNTNFKFLDKQ